MISVTQEMTRKYIADCFVWNNDNGCSNDGAVKGHALLWSRDTSNGPYYGK
jgi:hypothetical protein